MEIAPVTTPARRWEPGIGPRHHWGEKFTKHIPDETAGARRCTSPPLAGAVQLPPGGPEFLAELLGYKKLTRSSNNFSQAAIKVWIGLQSS